MLALYETLYAGVGLPLVPFHTGIQQRSGRKQAPVNLIEITEIVDIPNVGRLARTVLADRVTLEEICVTYSDIDAAG